MNKGAEQAQHEANNAPWLTIAHVICTDAGIAHGPISGRLEALRDKLADKAQQTTDPLGFQIRRAIAAEDELRATKQTLEHAYAALQKVADAQAAIEEPELPEATCCYHDSDCAVHNMPAYPAGPCDCSQANNYFLVTGKYERRVFVGLSSAEAYCKGLNKTFHEGNYVVGRLFTATQMHDHYQAGVRVGMARGQALQALQRGVEKVLADPEKHGLDLGDTK